MELDAQIAKHWKITPERPLKNPVYAEIVKIQEMDKIFEAGITGTPGLGIDGEIKSMGRIPSVGEIKKWIESKK